MITRLSAWLVSGVVLLTPIQAIAQETRSRSILVLDQSDRRGLFYYQLYSGLRLVVNADIRRDDLRASEVIRRMRSLLMRAPFEANNIDINDTMREVFDFLSIQASARNVTLYLKPSPEPLG